MNQVHYICRKNPKIALKIQLFYSPAGKILATRVLTTKKNDRAGSSVFPALLAVQKCKYL